MTAQVDSRSGSVRGKTSGANMTQRSRPGNPKVARRERRRFVGPDADERGA
jgi:hypothetical protein